MAKLKPKPARRRQSSRQDSVKELIKSNNHLNKYCNFISLENHKMAFELQRIIVHLGYLESRLIETQKMVNLMISNLNPSSADKIKREMNEVPIHPSLNESYNHEKNTSNGLHDNTTRKCPVCSSIGTIRDEACKECGYKK